MSAILSADALNDFIGPSVACIKPIESLPPPPTEPTVGIEDASTVPNDARTAAQISLTDCLACSGCVTSSEAVLVQMQSHNEVLSALSQFPDKTFVALVSPQTRAALAVAWGITQRKAGVRVEALLREVGFAHAVDTDVFRVVEQHYAVAEALAGEQQQQDRKRPILTSACPGFICYLESTHPELIPHLSALKSPQAIAGTFIKALMVGEGAVRTPEEVYVVAVMPCFDKKLEGARGELTSAVWRPDTKFGETPARDVDCVITTRELLSLAEKKELDPAALPVPSPAPPLSTSAALRRFLESPTLPTHVDGSDDSGTSGGTLVSILSALLEKHPSSTLQIQPGRNVDTRDYIVVGADGEVIVRLSRCYGFRNIQNLVRRLKPAKTRVLPKFGGSSRRPPGAAVAGPTAATAGAARRVAAKKAGAAADDKSLYVEVMACPGGCTNGGGQIKWDDAAIWEGVQAAPVSQRDLLARVDEAYYSSGEGEERDNKLMKEDTVLDVEQVVAEWTRITGVEMEKLVMTSYRKVKNDIGKKLGDEEVLERASREGGGW